MKLILGNIIDSPKLNELRIIHHGAIELNDEGTITNIYKNIPSLDNYEVYDYKDCLIIPSFCDMHLHAPQYPMLGMGMDLPLIEWLNTYTFKTESYFSNKEYAREIYKKLAKDLIDNGTTRVAMFSSLHTDSTLILMEELEKAGVTGFVGKVNMDRNGDINLQETTKESIDETYRFLKECKKFKYLKPIITPRFTPSCTNELMAKLGEIANKDNLYVQSHLNENKNEIEWVKSLHPDIKYYYQSYEKYGLWKSHTIMAHCVHMTDEEIKSLKDNEIVVAHCPDSNVSLVSGVCPVRQLLNNGIWVTLGSDIAGGSQLPMYKNIQSAIKVSKIQDIITNGRDKFLSVNEAFYLATTSGHRYFDNSQGFEINHKLHALVIDDSSFTKPVRELTLQERFERAIYNMDKSNIVHVYSEGRKIK